MSELDAMQKVTHPPRRFTGLYSLYGEQGLANLQKSHVVVIGVGGVGSWAVEALARNAIGHITMIDMDMVAESNINRQLPAMHSTVGKDKTIVLKERVMDINPDCQIDIIDDFVSVTNATEILPKQAEYVLDCIDNFRVKAAIIAHCKRKKMPVLTVGGAGGQVDPTRIQQVDLSRTQHDALFAKTRKLLRQDYDFARNPKRTFGVPCVYSDEQVSYADGHGGLTKQKPESTGSGLSCAGGLGSSMQVTSTFAMVAVARIVNDLIEV
ncbi:MAG: tRNA threonylcarbamoyladenosine dehydratase [Arenicella sp.]